MILRVILISKKAGGAGRHMETETVPDRMVQVMSVGTTPTVNSMDLFAGGREIIVRHGEMRYRLRVTNSNKLILIK